MHHRIRTFRIHCRLNLRSIPQITDNQLGRRIDIPTMSSLKIVENRDSISPLNQPFDDY